VGNPAADFYGDYDPLPFGLSITLLSGTATMLSRASRWTRQFLRNEDGAALVEYGILVALIAIVCIVIVATVGNKISAKFSEMNAKIT
jgi:pilus assembly protein Flp/PilA